MSVKTLNDMGFENASHIETGFIGCKADGLPIVTYEEWQAARES